MDEGEPMLNFGNAKQARVLLASSALLVLLQPPQTNKDQLLFHRILL